MHEGVGDGSLVETIHDGATSEGQDQCTHLYGDGVYIRGLPIPKGTAVIGKLHKQARVCVVAFGDCTFTDEFQTKRVVGPWAGEFRGGTKTCVFAHTATYWWACFGTDLKNPEEIVDDLTAKSFDGYADFAKQRMELLK